MIRPATDLLSRHLARTIGAVLVFAATLVVPGGVVFLSASAHDLAEERLADYRPVVYTTPEAEAEQIGALSADIAAWEGVEKVEKRTPQQAHRLAQERLGDDSLSRLGVEASMFPTSLVVHPAGVFSNRVDLVARVAALETRDVVASVDVPSEQAGAVVGWARVALVGGMVFLVGSLLFASYYLSGFLSAMRGEERRELALMERFGATPSELRRSTLVRGFVVGFWAGLVAFAVLLLVALWWRTVDAELLGGTDVETLRHWLVVGAPLVVGPLVGGGLGAWVSRSSVDRPDGTTPEGLDRLLDYS